MSIFAVTYVYADADTQALYRPEHRKYLASKLEEKNLIASGPFTSGDTPGALLIFSADSHDDVEKMIAKDPMNIGGAVLSYTIREWNPVLGSLGA